MTAPPTPEGLPQSGRRVLIAGVSTRAAAESAARAGFVVTALDGFGDRDQHPAVRALSLPRDFGARFSPRAAADASRAVPCDAVAYVSSFENHPRAVRVLAAGRVLLGNRPAVLGPARDPAAVARAFADRGFDTPAVWTAAQPPPRAGGRSTDADGAGWLLKPRASGGGHAVCDWRDGPLVPRRHYLQARVEGVPGSVVFVADGRRAVPLGVSRQLVGDPAFGGSGFRYCGSILAAADDPQFDDDAELADRAAALAAAAAEAFRLVGVNGVDFVAAHGVPHPIEVNPRYSASMELVERAYGVPVFGVHAAACASAALPRFDLSAARRGTGALGKAIVYARRDTIVGDTDRWLADASVRDVPHPGEHIPAGRPVCTVFAEGRDAALCYRELARRAARIYGELDAWERVAA